MAEGGGKEKVTGNVPAVFISYASPDSAVAGSVCDALERAGVSCWLAPRDVMPGDFYGDAIVHAIDAAKAVVLILSRHSAGSPHVLREVERATSKRHPVVSLRTDQAPLPAGLEYFLNTSQWLDSTALGTDAALPKLVQAVQRIVAPAPVVELAHPDDTAKPVASPLSQPSVGTQETRRLGRPVIALSAVIALGLAYVVADKFWISKHLASERPVTALAPAPGSSASVASEKSIAVLPFTDMSEKKDQEYFGDGMAEEILNVLAKIPQLKVIGRTSSFQFKGKNEDLREVGRKLGARYVLEGSVRQEGPTVRLTAQLIDARDGAHVWSETYDRPVKDLLKVQGEVAVAIARMLELSIGVDPRHHATEIRSAEGYNDYLRALSMLNRYDEVGVSQADIGFRAALARDPSFVRAREELTFAHFIQAAWGFTDAKSGFALATQDAEGLLASDPGSAYAKAILGSIALFRFDWAEAGRQLAAARLASPNNITALFSSGDLAAAFGRWAEATNYYNMVLTLDPLNSNAWNELGFMLYRAGRLPEGEAAIRRCLAITPTFAGARADLGFILLARGQPTEALAEMDQDTDSGFGLMGRALVYHALGRKADADAALAELNSSSADRHAYRVAQVHAFRGERDEAFRWLERAYTQQDAELQYVKGEWLLRSLERDPRYLAFLRKMKLPE